MGGTDDVFSTPIMDRIVSRRLLLILTATLLVVGAVGFAVSGGFAALLPRQVSRTEAEVVESPRPLVADSEEKERTVSETRAALPQAPTRPPKQKPENRLERRLLRADRTLDLKRVRGLLRDPKIREHVVRVLNEADFVVGEALSKRERLRRGIMKDRIERGLCQVQKINTPLGEPERGELICKSCKWDPDRREDVQMVVRIYPGESAELDAARAELRESIRLRVQLLQEALR